MTIVNQVIDEICEGIDARDRDNRPKVVKIARQRARITCRELGAVLDLKIGQISDIEHGRLDVSDDVITAWFMVCASKIVVQKEMANKLERDGCVAGCPECIWGGKFPARDYCEGYEPPDLPGLKG